MERYHENWYSDGPNAHPEPTSKVARQTLRLNHLSTTENEYYRVAVTIPFLDHIICEFDKWFKELDVYSGVNMLPRIVLL